MNRPMMAGWWIECVMFAVMLLCASTASASYQQEDDRAAHAEWCSDSPLYSYVTEINLCAGAASDCYSCITWAR